MFRVEPRGNSYIVTDGYKAVRTNGQISLSDQPMYYSQTLASIIAYYLNNNNISSDFFLFHNNFRLTETGIKDSDGENWSVEDIKNAIGTLQKTLDNQGEL